MGTSQLGAIGGMLCGLVFVLVFAGAGVYAIVTSVRSKRKAEASQSWPSATGRILSAEIVRHAHHDEHGTR